jgi:very-short-patch-repair endonuclease
MAWKGGNPAVSWFYDALTYQTEPEIAMEPHVAALGTRYRCQHPVGGFKYRIDFALLDEGIAIEVDDDSHFESEKAQKDRERTKWLTERGWVVVRCTNSEARNSPGPTVQRLVEKARSARKVLADMGQALPLPEAPPPRKQGRRPAARPRTGGTRARSK